MPCSLQQPGNESGTTGPSLVGKNLTGATDLIFLDPTRCPAKAKAAQREQRNHNHGPFEREIQGFTVSNIKVNAAGTPANRRHPGLPAACPKATSWCGSRRPTAKTTFVSPGDSNSFKINWTAAARGQSVIRPT